MVGYRISVNRYFTLELPELVEVTANPMVCVEKLLWSKKFFFSNQVVGYLVRLVVTKRSVDHRGGAGRHCIAEAEQRLLQGRCLL